MRADTGVRRREGGPRARVDMGAEHHAHAHTGQASVPCRHADFPDAAPPNLAGSRGWRKTGVAPGRPAPAFELPAHRSRVVGHFRHRSEEHTSELQSLMRISYAVFCLKKKTLVTTLR